jgi:hypothetical protein
MLVYQQAHNLKSTQSLSARFVIHVWFQGHHTVLTAKIKHTHGLRQVKGLSLNLRGSVDDTMLQHYRQYLRYNLKHEKVYNLEVQTTGSTRLTRSISTMIGCDTYLVQYVV